MTDRLTQARRSWLMSRIPGKDTLPEMRVRRLLHRLGYRFRLHVGALPGRPDIVFPARGKIVFVDGCFWHGHYCKRSKMPKSKTKFWTAKIETNQRRDRAVRARLRRMGWACLTVWECQTKDEARLRKRLVAFLGRPGSPPPRTRRPAPAGSGVRRR
jgi:DNA mismatch endonuclease (patch repair protein)